MDDIVIDFETYFDSQVSLKKLPTLAYIRHPSFKVHGAAVKIGTDAAQWFPEPALTELFDRLDWSHMRVISHNSLFDLTVLHERYGVTPGERVDTLGLCRALLPRDLEFGLDNIGPILGLEGKKGGGQALQAIKGVVDPTQEQLDALGEYAVVDAEITYGLYQKLYPHLPEREKAFMNLILRASTQGVFEVDDEAMHCFNEATQEIIDHRYETMHQIGLDPDIEAQRKRITSRDQFAKLLQEHGIEPPTKVSSRTGKETWAFSRTDPAFIDLRADQIAGPFVEARLAWASNTAISRIRSLKEIGSRWPYTIPVQLNPSGARTHRLSGGGGINTQNLNARGRGSGLRRGFRVRNGYVVIVYDLSKIELVLNFWLANDPGLESIRQGGDPYREQAAAQYGVPASQIGKEDLRRQLGKAIELGCFAGNTEVLTPYGWWRIDSLPKTVPVWDGVEWVSHDGVVDQGVKETTWLKGVRVTPDHKMLLREGQWISANDLARKNNTLSQALATAKGLLPSRAMFLGNEVGFGSWLCNAIANVLSILSVRITGVTANLKAVRNALTRKAMQVKSVIGAMQTLPPMMPSANDCSTGYLPSSTDAITQTIEVTLDTEGVASTSTNRGETVHKAVDNFLNTSPNWTDTTALNSNWIVSTTTAGTSPATFALPIASITQRIVGLFNSLRQKTQSCGNALNSWKKNCRTYDILNAGPRNRFMIRTNAGPLIAHNCGYGMGPPKFRVYLAGGPLGMDPIRLTEEQARQTIDNYRRTRHRVVNNWHWLDNVAIPHMAFNRTDKPLQFGPIEFVKEAAVLPNGMRLNYTGLRLAEDDSGWVFGVQKDLDLWGGTLDENIVQALAGVLIKDHMLEIDRTFDGDTFTRIYQRPQFRGWREEACRSAYEQLAGKAAVIHQVHDEMLVAAREQDADDVCAEIEKVMTTPPSWGPDIPLSVEGGYAQGYSK